MVMHGHPWSVFIGLGYVVSWSVIPFVLLANKPPVSTLNWIWVLLLFPWLGPLAYFLVGSDKLARRHLAKRKEIDDSRFAQRRLKEHESVVSQLAGELSEEDRGIVDLLDCINDAPASATGEVRLLIDAQSFYPALLEAIREAKHHIHVEFFIFRSDHCGVEMRDALTEAARRGVEVRLLCDQMGSLGTREKFFRPFVEAGGHFAWFRTVRPSQNRWVFNLRNHRKIQIIDGETVFVGGMNIGKEYMGEDPKCGSWRDAQVRLRGPIASVVQFNFADDWYYATEEKLVDEKYFPKSQTPPRHIVQVVADGPDNNTDPIQMSMVALLNAAKKRAWLTAGYFVPNEPLLTAMKICAGRGVDVRLLVSAKTDHPYLLQVGRSYYEELLEFGVRIFEYEKGINHAKVASFDSRWLMVGSANFDIRSMRLNFELNVLMNDSAAAEELERVLLDDYEKDSQEIHLEEFKNRPFVHRCWESLFRPLAPLL
jgi:cardiolipin synthase